MIGAGGLLTVDRLKSRCVLSRTDAVEQHHGPDAIWKKFIGCFGVLGSFLRKWGVCGGGVAPEFPLLYGGVHR